MLEDNHEDIIAKAMRGQKIGKSALSNLSGLKKTDIIDLLKGNFTKESIFKIAPHLKLDPQKLLISAKKQWAPDKIEILGLDEFESAFGSMTVNSYILYDLISKDALLFDTGTQCSTLNLFIKEQGLKVDSIILTHTHRDHILCLDEMKQNFGNPKVFVHKSEPLQDSILIQEGFSMNLGRFSLQALHTHGHSAGGLTYLIEGLPCPVAIVGDALFAGSMGGGMVSYQDALQTNREKIMTLPDNCVLCPGHGPMTTVGEEKNYNPFFPEF